MNELEIIHHRQIEGLSVFFDTVDYRTPHIHPEWELIWLLENPLSVACGQSHFQVEPGQLVLFSPNEPHEFHKIDKSATFLCIQISSALLPNNLPLTIDEKLPHQYFSEAELNFLKDQLARVMAAYLQREEHYDLYCVGQSYLFLHQLLTRLPSRVLTPEELSVIDKRNARLKRLIRFVDDNYMHKIRLADFAEKEGCSMGYLSHFIKDTMNQTFQEYVASVRFNCACKLIASGETCMLDVCMASGFSDYRYFSRAFRRQYDMTPEEYSHYTKKIQLESRTVHHSLHSAERFYSREESIRLMNRYLPGAFEKKL